MSHSIAWYREFLPCAALQPHVYAIYSFVPERTFPSPARAVLCEIPFDQAGVGGPQFADGHVSLVFDFPRVRHADGRWSTLSQRARGTVIGPLTHVGPTEPRDLTEQERLERVESALLARLQPGRPSSGSIDVEGLAALVRRHHGQVTVDALAGNAGVSRQYLSREFRERLGVPPKLYSRLARFHSGLVYVGCGTRVNWSNVAIDMGYADQSHMIAEFRQFGGLTPQALAARDWRHPFVDRARSRKAPNDR